MDKKQRHSKFWLFLGIFIVFLCIRSQIKKSPVVSLLKVGFGLYIAFVVIVLAIVGFALLVYKSSEKNKSRKTGGATAQNIGSVPPKQPQPDTVSDMPEPERTVFLKSRGDLATLRAGCKRIRDERIRGDVQNVCEKIERILCTLREQPEEINGARQFLNYYLPTMKDVLDRYLTLEKAETVTDDMKDKFEKFLKDVSAAMDKQYESLFHNEQMDMSVDMEAMKIALQRDGLL